MVRWVTIILSICGLAVGVWAVAESKPQPKLAELARPASVNPYPNGIAALGFVEPSSRSIGIAAPEAAMVLEVMVEVGDKVTQNQPLMRLDGRRIQADLVRAEAALKSGEAEVARWYALPRAEDLPPLEAAVARAEAVVADRAERERLTLDASKRGGGTERDVTLARFSTEEARAALAEAKAALARVKAGGWAPDLALVEGNLARLRAEVEALRLLLDRVTVRAPRAGLVLRREVDPGEFASVDPNTPNLIIGDLDSIRVRAQVDEEDIALLGATVAGPAPQPRAIARTRGAILRDIPLKLLRIEPFARPKTDLNGTNTERVDTRIVDVVFEASDLGGRPLYPGQAVDVFVEVGRDAPAPSPAPAGG